MKEIKLTKGKIALVDDEDFEYLNQWKWCAMNNKSTFYAVRGVRLNGKNKLLRMHRIIMKTPTGFETDHKDMNGLNNQKLNLRICTHKQNGANRNSHGMSKYLGVSFVRIKYKNKVYSSIRAYITINDKYIHLGCFKTEELAALAYNKAALKYFGEFATINNFSNHDHIV